MTDTPVLIVLSGIFLIIAVGSIYIVGLLEEIRDAVRGAASAERTEP